LVLPDFINPFLAQFASSVEGAADAAALEVMLTAMTSARKVFPGRSRLPFFCLRKCLISPGYRSSCRLAENIFDLVDHLANIRDNKKKTCRR
jgi:hypothetical protein